MKTRNHISWKNLFYLAIAIISIMIIFIVAFNLKSFQPIENIPNINPPVSYISTSSENLTGKWLALNNFEDGIKTDFIREPQIIFEFKQDGTIFGKACNNLVGGYSVTTDTGLITIPGLTSTRMYCSDPKDLMSNEILIGLKLGQSQRFEVVEHSILRIYYTKNNYLEFSKV